MSGLVLHTQNVRRRLDSIERIYGDIVSDSLIEDIDDDEICNIADVV